MTCGCGTYCPLVQEGVVELHKLLLRLFRVEVLEELSVKVAQLTVQGRKKRNQSPVATKADVKEFAPRQSRSTDGKPTPS